MDTNKRKGRSHSEDSPAWQPRRVMLILGCAIAVALLLFAVTDSIYQGFSGTRVAAMIIVGVILGLLFVIRLWQPTVKYLHRVKDYDTVRFNRFKSALDGVSVGLGIEPPGLIVMDAPFPDSCITTVGGKPSVVVSPELLAMDLTDHEVEAVMATGAAKAVYDRMERSWPDVFDEMKVPGDISRRGKNVAWNEKRSSYCSFVLRTDTLAARTTGEPGALRSAIEKVRDAVVHTPQRVAYVPSDRFVDPPLTRGKRQNRLYEQLNSLRLENLERMMAGERQAFSELRGGKPVVAPKGWQ